MWAIISVTRISRILPLPKNNGGQKNWANMLFDNAKFYKSFNHVYLACHQRVTSISRKVTNFITACKFASS